LGERIELQAGLRAGDTQAALAKRFETRGGHDQPGRAERGYYDIFDISDLCALPASGRLPAPISAT